MEKQPDKFEVLMDWFLGDAKEITASQKEMTEILSALSEKLAKDTESLGETADSLKRTLVENQRSISLAISDDAKAREEFLTKFRRAQASRAETLTRQILFITAGCTIVGAAVGAHDDEVEVPVCKARELEVGLADKELRLDIEARHFKGIKHRLNGFMEARLLLLVDLLAREHRHHRVHRVGRDGIGHGFRAMHDRELGVFAEEFKVLEHVVGGSGPVGRTVDEDADPHFLFGELRFVADHEHRHVRPRKKAVRDRAEDEALHGIEPAGAHDDQIGLRGLGLLGEHLHDVAVHHAFRCGAELRTEVRLFLEVLENVDARILVVLFDLIEAEKADERFRHGVLHVDELDLGIGPEERIALKKEMDEARALAAFINGNKNAHKLLFLTEDSFKGQICRSSGRRITSTGISESAPTRAAVEPRTADLKRP